MNTLTHALLPVLGVSILRSKLPGKSIYWNNWRLAAVGVAAALPDLMNPHITLQGRFTSWSHGIPCWLVFTCIILAVGAIQKSRLGIPAACVCSFGYLAHLFCDAISGGLAWLYPFRLDIVGKYYITPHWWRPLDIICFLSAYAVFRLIPAHRRSAGREEECEGEAA